VLRVAYRLKELGIAPRSANVLGWAAACGVDQERVELAGAGAARRLGPRVINLGTSLMVLGLGCIVLLARAAHGVALDGRLLAAILIIYGLGQGLALPSLVATVVGSSRIPAADAGSASGVFSTVQQVAFALGVAAIGGVFFGVLGEGTSHADYDAALAAALSCNMGLLSATFMLALWLPRAGTR
jgi:hypothetical protein